MSIPYDTTTTIPDLYCSAADDYRSRYLLSRDFGTPARSMPWTPQTSTISAAKYKLATRTDQQAKLFPELEKEIAERRARLTAEVRDQKSETFKREINSKVPSVVGSGVYELDVLARARHGNRVVITACDSICQMRPMDADCYDALHGFRESYLTREAETTSSAGASPPVLDDLPF